MMFIPDRFAQPGNAVSWVRFFSNLTDEHVHWMFEWFPSSEFIIRSRETTHLVLIRLRGIYPYAPIRVMRQAGRKQVIPQVSNMVQYMADFKGDAIPFKFEAQHMWNQKVIVEKETIKPDRYHAGHMYCYLSWLEDDVAEDIKKGINLKDRNIDKAAEAQVKYIRLCKRVFESEAKHVEQHKVNMEVINEWMDIATNSTERLEYLEQGLMKLEGKMRKRLSDCQGTDGSEGGHLAKSYLLCAIWET
uniref:Uncharacterized protein n=1 Tax=Nicotiana tabacum TaxID=4097 RepID=A0A1S3ZWV3_TOBAC|nr:PREDICTED: uncharacterized protein LOC107791298 [Nicotiana tabacum]